MPVSKNVIRPNVFRPNDVSGHYLIMWTDNGLVASLDEVPDAVDGGAVKVGPVLAVLNELAGLDVDLSRIL